MKQWTAEERRALKSFIETSDSLSWPAKTKKWNQKFHTGRTKEGIRGQWNREKLKLGYEPPTAVTRVSPSPKRGRVQKPRQRPVSQQDHQHQRTSPSTATLSDPMSRLNIDGAGPEPHKRRDGWRYSLDTLKAFMLCEYFGQSKYRGKPRLTRNDSDWSGRINEACSV